MRTFAETLFVKAFLSALTILFCTFCFAQEFPNLTGYNKVTTVGYWNLGQSASYHVQQTSSSFKGKSDKPSKTTTAGYDLRLKVIDSTETTYIFEMVYTDFTMDLENLLIANELAKLQENMTIVYQTNEYGQFDSILNLPELKADLLKKLEELKELIKDAEADEVEKNIYALVISNMVESFGKIDAVEALFAEDIYAIHGLYGVELELSKPLPVELEYSTLGDILLTGTGTITLSGINKTGDECSLTMVEKPDKEELKQYMETIALFFMMEEGKKMSMEELKITMSTKKKLKMELSSGWMNKVTSTSTINVTNKKGTRKRLTTMELTRI